jgi:energy-coupling factor transporter ATP-binding protein EcfA2
MQQDKQSQLANDRQELIKLLKAGKVKVSDYLTSNPSSTNTNDDLNGTITKLLFYKDFFVRSYKQYERIAQILDIAEDITKNIIFFSGFKGCGKTTFANYVRRLIDEDDNERLPHVKEDLISLLNNKELFNRNELYEFIKSLNSLLSGRIDNDKIESEILSANTEVLFNAKCKDSNFIKKLTKQINTYIDYLNANLPGRAIYLNFETEVDSPEPIIQKLNLNLKKRLLDIIDEGVHKSLAATLSKVFKAFGTTALERSENFFIRDFIQFIETDYMAAEENNNQIQDSLNKLLLPLKTAQLLSLLVLQDFAYLEHCKSKKKIYYIFDNLDVIYDTGKLLDLINSYFSFISDIPELMMKKKVKKVLKEVFNNVFSFHSDICFIFILRETSQMYIVDHIKNIWDEVGESYDISSDVDKSLIVNKKRMFLDKYLENDPANQFLADVKRIDTIVSDNYAKIRLAPLFNNDYKRIIDCLASICKSNREQVDEYLEICRRDNILASELRLTPNDLGKRKYGTLGIIFRLIFDHFKSNGYLGRIKVTEEKKHQVAYTPARLILLYLNRKQFYPVAKPFNNQDIMPLSELFSTLEKVMFENKNPDEAFAHVLAGMFNLRNTKTWSHLITFDSIKKSISIDDILFIIKEKEDVNVRITCAGRAYLRFITSHFEYYASRFYNTSKPLFSSANEVFNSKTNKYEFEKILEKIYNVVFNFCENMNEFMIKWKEKNPVILSEKIESSADFLYENKDRGYVMFHEERYIHHHITYIDTYRMYLINTKSDIFPDGIIDINKRILPILKRYINLLIEYDYYIYSEDLYGELNACYKYIVEQENYCSKDIEISSTSYKALRHANKVPDVHNKSQ